MTENQKLTQKTEKNSIVIYHKNCFDGYGAAWAAYKKYGNDAIYIPPTTAYCTRSIPPVTCQIYVGKTIIAVAPHA